MNTVEGPGTTRTGASVTVPVAPIPIAGPATTVSRSSYSGNNGRGDLIAPHPPGRRQ